MKKLQVRCELCGGSHPTSEHPLPTPEAVPQPEVVEIAANFTDVKETSLPALEKAMQQDGRDVDALIHELDAAGKARDYNARRPLIEALRQMLDVARLRGEWAPKQIVDALGRYYVADAYSDLMQEELVRTIPKDQPEVLVEALMDERFTSSARLVGELDEAVREQVYEELKRSGAVKGLINLVPTITDIGMKVRLFEDLAEWLTHHDSDEARRAMGSHGSFSILKMNVGFSFFRGARESFLRFLDRGLVQLSGLEEDLRSEQDESLHTLLVHTRTLTDATMVLKFMRSKQSLLSAARAFEQVEVSPDVKQAVVKRAEHFAEAFENAPRLLGLGTLQKRPPGMDRLTDPNKFVIVLPDDEHQAVIAWGNTTQYPYHKDLVKHLGAFPKELCSGGMIELVESEDGKTQIVFQGRSGDFGPFNQALLEQFKEEITQQIKQSLPGEVEVVIKAERR